jgi:cell division protein FtsA
VARSEIIAGLDIGTTKICTVVGEVGDEERVEIVAVGTAPSTGLRKGVIVDIPATVRAIEASVEQAERSGGVRIGSAYVGITGDHIASLNNRGVVAVTSADREIREEHLERAREAAGVMVLPPERQILHNIPRTYIVDGQEGVRYPIGMSATRLEVESHLVTGASTFIENVAKCAHRAGIAVEEVVLEPLASSLAVLTEAEKALGAALVDIGGGTTDVALFTDGAICHSAAIPVGGNHVTYDLSVGLRVSREQAEQLKIASGCALTERVGETEFVEVHRLGDEEPQELPRHVLAEIIEPRMEELFDLVRQQIEIGSNEMNRGVPLKATAGLVLTGGGVQLPGTAELATRRTGLPVRIGRPRGVGGLTEVVDSPTFATAVGLVQYGAAQHRFTRRALNNGSLVSAVLERVSRWFLRLSRQG